MIGTVPSSAIALILTTSASPVETGRCEAHVFPTDQIQGYTRLGDYGLVSDLLGGDPVPETEMLAQIKADAQFEITQSLLSRDGYLEGFAFIEQAKPVEHKTSTTRKSRLTGSLAPCYVEIVVNYISFSDSALTKKKVGVHFVTRDFRQEPEKPRIRKLGGAASIAPYIHSASDGETGQVVDFLGVYTEAFDAAIKRFWKR